MTIDERLDRLTARHEALTQTVELLLAAQLRNEERHEKNEEMQATNQAIQAKTQTMLAEIVDSIHSLERIAFSHEHRITRLEGGDSAQN
jgi:hypothetical protein